MYWYIYRLWKDATLITMPSTLVEICKEYRPSQEVAIMEGVHEALVHAFKIPEEDRNVRLSVFPAHRFLDDPSLAHPDRRTLVTVDAFAGRSLDAKRSLYRRVVENLESLGIPPDHVTVVVRDLPLESWGIRDGSAACDVDLGFEVRV